MVTISIWHPFLYEGKPVISRNVKVVGAVMVTGDREAIGDKL